MARTALDLTPEEWKQYTIPKRVVTPEVRARWERAWMLIPELVTLLREEFGATEVKVFGSAINVEYFWPDSDIDLAAWGIPPGSYYRAAGTVDEYSDEFRVDLVDPEKCRPGLRKAIDREGISIE
ncbi:MAG: nucleotidyltransferase domain-containing protein [Cyanobacteria bacterium P01_F01_bin.4]